MGRGNRPNYHTWSSNLIDDCREQSGVESDFEWFQWLAERIMEYVEGKKPQPAHIAYKDWQLPI
jgi:hypothetical protein